MGIAVPSQLLGRQHNNHPIQITMKAVAAAALATVAAASAAPEAQWLGAPAIVPINPHATTGELVTLPNGAQVPDTTASVKAAAADHLNAKAATYATYGYGLPLAGGIWKRDAEAEAEPWLGYGLGAWGLGIKSAPCVNAANIPVPCRGIWKREAEAEPWLGYGLAGWAPATGSPVAPLVAHPDGSVTPPVTPAVAAAAADHLATKGLAWPLAGLWKREADAEAEPWLGYGLGAWGLGIKSAPCVNAANIPVPCRGIWKREAEAEAEPWLGYGLAGWAPATGSPVAPLVAHPDGNVTPPHTPAVQAAAADHLATKAAAYGWGLPLAGLWKREAEAEAEPWLGYGYGLGAWGLAGVGPYGLPAVKSAPCVNAANIRVPC